MEPGASDLLRSVAKYTKVSLLAGSGWAWYLRQKCRNRWTPVVYVVRVDAASEY
jgi:hypothetical protein